MLASRLCGLIGAATLWALTSGGTTVQAIEIPLPPALQKAALTEAEGALARNGDCLAPTALDDLVVLSADHAVGVGRYVAEVFRARKWGGAVADCRCLRTIAVATIAHRPDAAAGVQASLAGAFPGCALPLQAAIEEALMQLPSAGGPSQGGARRSPARPGHAAAARTCADALSCLVTEPPHADVAARAQPR